MSGKDATGMGREAVTGERSTFTTIQERVAANDYARWLLSPGLGLLWVFLFLFAPLSIIVLFSFYSSGEYGTIVAEFTLENYARFLNSPTYQAVVAKSFGIGVLTTLIVLPLGYTLGYYLGRTETRWKPILLGLVVVQFWVPIIIRTYAWISVLGRQGLVNKLLLGLGVVNEPVQLLYTLPGMMVGLVVSLLPFMILPVYSSVSTIDDDIIQAAKTLGATDARAFREVTLPLSWPGIVSGILFTFIISAGAFIAPQLLGGPAERMVAPVIADVFLKDFNWPFAAALSLVYFLLIGVALYLFTRKADLEEALEGTSL